MYVSSLQSQYKGPNEKDAWEPFTVSSNRSCPMDRIAHMSTTAYLLVREDAYCSHFMFTALQQIC